jgi:hypothetical protein
MELTITPKRYTLIWRLNAAFAGLLWIIVLLVNLLYFSSTNTTLDWVRYGLTIGGCGFLVFFPLTFYIHAVLWSSWGLIGLFQGGGLPSIIMFGLGLVFALKQGFFSNYRKCKVCLVSLCFLAVLVSQTRFGMDYVLNTVLGTVELVIIAEMAVMLFSRELQELLRNGSQVSSLSGMIAPNRTFFVKGTELRLSPHYFTPHDVLLLRDVLAREKYEIIARTYNLGLSTLKKRLAVLFSLLDETNKTEFVSRYAHYVVQLETEAS